MISKYVIKEGSELGCSKRLLVPRKISGRVDIGVVMGVMVETTAAVSSTSAYSETLI